MNPECEILEEDQSGLSLHSGRVVPIYRRLGELRTRTLRQILYSLGVQPSRRHPGCGPILSRQTATSPAKSKAIQQIHFPWFRGTISGGPGERARSSQCRDFSGAQALHFRGAFSAPGSDPHGARAPRAACQRPEIPAGRKCPGGHIKRSCLFILPMRRSNH